METDGNSSLPLNEDQWETFLKKIKELHPNVGNDVIDEVCSPSSIKNEGKKGKNTVIAIPKEPVFSTNSSVTERVKLVQKYLNQLQYNHTGTQFFQIKMNRSIARLYDVAKDIIKYSLPIKCMEAVILALYLTSNIPNLTRFTIRFKSQFSKITHRHIVLGLYHNSKYGVVGLSRRKTLMYKPLSYESLSDVIQEFDSSYEKCYHKLMKVKLSPSISSEKHSCDHICWNYFVLPVGKMKAPEVKSSLEKYSRELRSKNPH